MMRATSDKMMDLLAFNTTPIALALLIISIGVYVLRRRRMNKTSPQPTPSTKKADPQYTEDAYYAIEPLNNLVLANTLPLKIRPFKPTYHMTMAIENNPLSDLIAMDNSLASRCQTRKNLIETERHEVLACNPIAQPAVLELYTWLTSTYLPTRFPTVYTLTPTHLLNNETHDSIPLHIAPADAETALEILGSNIDTEFFFMLPCPSEPSTKYRLEAFLNCTPSGFNTRSKLNLLLSQIHTPVPGYAQKLEKSMDRYFASLPVGKCVKRANWGISTTGDLFCLAGNHMSPEELEAREKRQVVEEVDLETTVLRCERQTLHRLPRTRALVFAFKTYQYPIRELRDEGSGEELAAAIDGLGKGNVPDITVYKRQLVWGDKVKAFLRGEIDA
ncbi:hypothetical protein CC86DRAFT_347042 [Ophiobolus disseminans]|uniref:HRQ family protein 2 n=1 Tax=Ophiobolus disseminans TaxID=1469910 RepID=A0A6A7A7C3_9PLEO|nr:hypothetical protein CC86DRAFT_347042 [Ophiobolus disseminans]